MAASSANTRRENTPVMRPPADFTLQPGPSGLSLALTGDWTAMTLGHAPDRLIAALAHKSIEVLDVRALKRLDTAGVFVLTQQASLSPKLLTGAGAAASRADIDHLQRLVADAAPKAPPPSDAAPRLQWLARIGRGVENGGHDAFRNLTFYGELLTAVARLLRHPARVRAAPTVSQIESAGLSAIPIVAATNLFVGATVAFLGSNLLAQFGASVFAVELVGVAVLREFAVLITAVILAGRSASSFAAEIGAMNMNQEIDAMEVMGVDPFDALVLPRFIALFLMTPLLTLVAMAAGLAGGLLVLWPVLDLSPQFFLARIVANVGPTHFWLGMSKAPVMAMVVAAIGCRHGFEVRSDVEQLGRHVTSAVVQSLFSIIAIDALFALMFMELNL